jgi:hypothetical protein
MEQGHGAPCPYNKNIIGFDKEKGCDYFVSK